MLWLLTLALPASLDGDRRPADARVSPPPAYTVRVIERGVARDYPRFTRGQTVLDAVASLRGVVLAPAKVRISVVRRGRTLAVDWRAIVRDGDAETNHALAPGDFVVVELR